MLTNLQRDQGDVPVRPAIEEVEQDGQLILRLSGAWTTRNVAEVNASMNRLGGQPDGPIVLDLSGIERMDTAGAWLVDRLIQQATASGRKVYIQGQSASMEVLLSAIQEAAERAKPPEPERRPNFVLRALEALGRLVYAGFQDFLGAMHILGATLRGGGVCSWGNTRGHRHNWRGGISGRQRWGRAKILGRRNVRKCLML